MKYLEFRNAVRDFPLISSSQLSTITKRSQVLRNQLNQWQKKGLVLKLKRGLYILNENDRKIHPSRIFLANSLYTPSYVSTEYALGYYGLIPERVADVTSITTKKTDRFRNSFGIFVYQHLKTDLFFGFTKIQDENGHPVLIAKPEKAVLDFIYLNLQGFKNGGKEVFRLSYRFQNMDLLKTDRLANFAEKYGKKGFAAVVASLLHFVEEER